MRKLLSPGVFGGALFLLLIFQVFYFYHTSRSLATSHSPTTCAGAVPSSVQDDLPCHQLDEAHCQLRSSECYPIRGERCGGTAGESEFLECVTNYQAVQSMYSPDLMQDLIFTRMEQRQKWSLIHPFQLGVMGTVT